LDIVDNEDFLCTECHLGRFPMFNDIVWVKYGHYKWWPSLVVHALQIPDSIERRPHSVGEFVVRFLGNGQQYAWVSHGRAFRYMDGDQHEKIEPSADRAYHRALMEAAELLNLKKELREIAENDEDGGGLPKREWNDYKHIEHNTMGVGGRINNQLDRSEYPICSCDPFKPNPCSSDSECSNRATQIECNEDCPAGEKCCNRRFAKCLYVETQPFDAGRKLGYGLRTMVDIPQGAFVVEYCGELIGKTEFKRRWQAKMECNDTGFYFLTLDRDRTIDAEPAGNYARFMNHSCRPNCSTFVWQVGNDIRVGLFACRKISAGENLTFHYNMDSLDAEGQIPCRCGEDSCMGTIGKRPKAGPITAMSGEANKKKKKKRQDKRCFRCRGELNTNGTRLFSCCRRSCTRVFHADCLVDPPKMSEDQWVCPSHFCDNCKQRATRMCSKCPRSWCEKHFRGNLKQGSDLCNDPGHDIPIVSGTGSIVSKSEPCP